MSRSTATRWVAAVLCAGVVSLGGWGGAELVAQQPSLPGPPSGLPAPEDAPSLVAPEGQGPAPGVAGDHLMYIGTYRDAIYVLDEATEEVVDRIDLESGIPRSISLNADRTRFYVVDVTYEFVEVVDIASRESIEVHSLSQGPETVRVWGMAVAPDEDYAILLIRSYRSLPDRFEVGPMRLVQYDLEAREIIREVPWPDDRKRQGVNLRFSRDGRWLYFLLDDIRVYDTEDFSEVGRWDYSGVMGGGLEDFSFGFSESVYEDRGIYTGIFRVTDPVQDRVLMGVARVDLDEREVDARPLGPTEPRMRFALAPDGRTAYGLKDQVDDYEFWTMDLDQAQVTSRARFRGRSRMLHEVSSSGEVIYIYNAGNTIDMYRADDYAYMRTIVLDTDTTSGLIILPRTDGPAGGS